MIRKLPTHSVGLAAAILTVLVFSSMPASAAGCHTVCQLTVAPECMSCGYTAFQNIFCLHYTCALCEEDSCSYLVATMKEPTAIQAAQPETCPAPSSTAPTIRIIKVRTLAARG